MRKLTKAFAAAAAAALALTAAGCGSSGSSGGASESPVGGVIQKAADQKKLIIGTKADQPGLGLQTGTTYEGYDINISKIIAKGLGVPDSGIQFVTTVSANREPFIEQGTVDMVVATYTINDERKQKVAFGGPYYVAGQDLLVRSDSTITGPTDLAGKTACSVAGSTPAQRMKTDFPNVKLQLFDAYSKCVQAFNNKGSAIEAVTTDDIILAGYASQPQYAGKFKVVGKPFSTEPYGIGLKKSDKAGCEKVNEILKAAAADGSYKAAWDQALGSSGLPAPTLDESKLTNCG